ncbi:MAG: PAS domain S-box protein [Rhodoferax sp.]|uniref:PAS domain-containing protein n=1 Tax=Rhodoferax sp. TaxID=50421 RepID=UPI002615A2EF|nr:PAS domain S-box protein [Rhodoferax sp.]MDD5336509.1 PAS domain S-box protein [Rhodoferax sp.]
MSTSFFRLEALTDVQAVEMPLMVSSCILALAATLFFAISLWATGPSVLIAIDLWGAVACVLQIIWIKNKNRLLVPSIWLLTLMAGIVFFAVYFNGQMSVYWLYPTIVYAYFWLAIKQAIVFSFAYTLLICAALARVNGFDFWSDCWIFGAALMAMGLLYFYSLVRDRHLEKLTQGNSEYKSQAEMLTGRVQSLLEEIKQSEERFNGIANATQEAIVMVDDEGKFTCWNLAAERMFGYRREDVLGQEFHHVLASARYRAAFESSLAGFRATGTGPVVGKTTELIAMHKDGREFPISLSISPLRLNQHWNAVGILRDATEHQFAEAARMQLGAIVESSVVSIMGVDLNGLVTSWNLGAQNVYGYTAAEMIGQPAAVLVPTDSRAEIENLIGRIKRDEEVPRFETTRSNHPPAKPGAFKL